MGIVGKLQDSHSTHCTHSTHSTHKTLSETLPAPSLTTPLTRSSEWCSCGADKEKALDGTYLKYFPFRAMIERSQMTPYHKKLADNNAAVDLSTVRLSKCLLGITYPLNLDAILSDTLLYEVVAYGLSTSLRDAVVNSC